jgi:pimeloyl-ACP methyl ester carboxylesterase
MTEWPARLRPWQFTASDGARISGWHTDFSGDRPIIYFRHGNGFSGLVYQPMLEILAAEADLVLCDAQGHGDSGDSDFFGWSAAARHGAEHIASQRGQWPAVPLIGLGHSFGGVLTVLMAAGGTGFAGCVLLDPVLMSPPLMAYLQFREWLGLPHPKAALSLRRRRQWANRDEAFQRLRGRGTFAGWTDASLWAYVNHALMDAGDGVALKCRPELEADIFSSRPRRLWQAVRRDPVRTHIIAGADTMPFVIGGARRAVRLNANFDCQLVPGGHCFMQQYPEAAAASVLAQLRGWRLLPN